MWSRGGYTHLNTGCDSADALAEVAASIGCKPYSFAAHTSGYF